MDQILISGLSFDTLIGVYEWERHSAQTLTVDLILSLDLDPASQSDDVTKTVDYAAVAHCVKEIGKRSEFELLEALAGEIIKTLLAEFSALLSVQVRLSKPGILPEADDVSVQMLRRR